jgi:BMFP domain-containing protein YqiC
MPHRTDSLIEELLTFGEKAFDQALKARPNVKRHIRQALNDLASSCDLVTREEFDAAMAMIAKARAIQEELKERLESIEKKLNLSRTSEKVTRKKKSLPSVKQGKRRKRRQV